MNADQSWMEITAMHSGMGELFMKHRLRVIELFKEHIRRFDSACRLQCEHDVRRYFANCFSQSNRVGKLMREQLQEIDRAEQNKRQVSPFEELKEGKRTYLGRIIPEDAPPRPDAYAVFDEGKRVWHR